MLLSPLPGIIRPIRHPLLPHYGLTVDALRPIRPLLLLLYLGMLCLQVLVLPGLPPLLAQLGSFDLRR